jgi:hypothetical protein
MYACKKESGISLVVEERNDWKNTQTVIKNTIEILLLRTVPS